MALALTLVATGACSSADGAQTPEIPGGAEALTAPATADDRPLGRGDFIRELLLTGELQAVDSISIKAPQTSLFQMRIQFMAEEGSLVEAGDLLLEFDNSSLTDQVRGLETQILDAQTQIVSARSSLASALKDLEIEIAQKEYNHGVAALEAGVLPEILSRKDYAERQLALKKATEELAETRERIELTRQRGQAEVDVLLINHQKLEKDMLSAQRYRDLMSIRAPSRGLVVYERRDGTTQRYREGDSCWPGQGVVQLPDLSAMQVLFSVNEVDAPLLSVGMPLHITLDSFPGRELEGEILHLPSMAVKRDQTSKVAVFKVVASLSETWVGEMKPGMSTLGRVVIERRHDVPLAARSAVRFEDGRYSVRYPGGDGTIREATFEPTDRNHDHYVLSEEDLARLTGGAAS